MTDCSPSDWYMALDLCTFSSSIGPGRDFFRGAGSGSAGVPVVFVGGALVLKPGRGVFPLV